MLDINLAPKHGNASGRSFPHSGYLGLSTVTLAGTFTAKKPPLAEPLLVKSIQVRLRCYEIRTAGVFANAAENVLYETAETLFTPTETQEFQPLESDHWERPFRIQVPVTDGLHSSATFKEYKIVWKLEALVDYKPITYIGSRIFKSFIVNLYNHSTPASASTSPLSSPLELVQNSISYRFDPPSAPAYGPGDSLPLVVRVKANGTGAGSGNAVVVKKVVFWLERRLEILDDREPTPPSTTTHTPNGTSPSPPRPPSRIHSLFHRSSSNSSPPLSSTFSISQKITEVSTEDVVVDGDWTTCTATMVVPRKGGKWDTGESVRTGLVNVEFELFAKVSIKTTKSREITLPSVPVTLTSVGSEDRAAARSAIVTTRPSTNKRRATSRASSSSSSTSKRTLYLHDSSLDISAPVERRAKTRSPPGSPTSPARPRTSAGKLERSHTPGVSSILRPSTSIPSSTPKPSISFIFPSPPPSRGTRNLSMPPPSLNVLPPISSFLPTPPDSYASSTELDYDSLSLMRQFATSGRRISTTTSEEDELQPLRSRQKLDSRDLQSSFTTRPSLPSLGALGLGLPQLPENDSRPSSASGVLTLSPTLGGMSEYTVANRPHTASTVERDSFRYRPIMGLPSHPSPKESSFAFAPPPTAQQSSV